MPKSRAAKEFVRGFKGALAGKKAKAKEENGPKIREFTIMVPVEGVSGTTGDKKKKK